jgi:hypothetical protein
MRMNMFRASDKVKPDIENIRSLNLVMVKLMTIQVTKWLLCIVQKEEFSITCYTCDMYIFIRDKLIL